MVSASENLNMKKGPWESLMVTCPSLLGWGNRPEKQAYVLMWRRRWDVGCGSPRPGL